MRTKGMEQVGECTVDNLIAGNRHPVDICHITIKEGQNLKRGTVLEEDAAGGTYVERGTVESAEAEYILAEDADATEGDTTGVAYRTGEFAENALIVKEGYEITEKDRKALRNAGIFLQSIMM